jgi:hypothetical protein
VRELLDAIRASECLELVFVTARAASRAPRRRSLHATYERLDRRLFGARDDALVPVDASDLLSAEPGAIAQCDDLDVLLDLTPHASGDLGDVQPRHGVWAVRLGNHDRSGASYFWEIFDGAALSEALLEVLPDRDGGGHVLYRAYWATDRLSPHRNRVAACWRLGDATLGRLLGLHEHGARYLADLPTFDERSGELPAPYAEPSATTLIRYLAVVAWGWMRRRVRRMLFEDQWCLAYRRRSTVPAHAGDTSGFQLITPPRDRFFADPFVIGRNGRHYLFFEDYPYDTGKGTISCLELGEDEPEPLSVVLERDYHLSYPFVFEHEDEAYMIPETSENGTIELYRALDFPDRWQLEAVLVRGIAAVDATLLRHDGRFWMFANVVAKGRTTEDELFLWTSESLHGPWRPHPMNPVVSDVRTARPAGRVFARDGHLIRPGQDCSHGYGRAVVLNRIVVLTETAYREVPAGRIGPEWLPGNEGSHTYNADDGYEVLDARRRIRRPGAWMQRYRDRHGSPASL